MAGEDALPRELAAFLAELGIRTTTVTHPPLFTVEESQRLRGQIPGAHTKNLFVKDKKGAIFLVTALEETAIDLKHLHRAIGASGRLSFASPEAMQALLGVVPGAVTLFGLMNDREGRVSLILDRGLLDYAEINAHPLVNTATTTIARDDLMRFIAATGHAAKVVSLTSQDGNEL